MSAQTIHIPVNIVICAWCPLIRVLKVEEVPTLPKSQFSHGICDEHYAQMKAEASALNRRAA